MSIERFGDFELDRGTGELRLSGRTLALQPRVFSLLAFLIENHKRVVDKDETSEQTANNCVRAEPFRTRERNPG